MGRLSENPVLQRELRGQFRGRRKWISLLPVAAAVPQVGAVLWMRFTVGRSHRSSMGLDFHETFAWAAFIICCVSPVLTASLIAAEREARTLDLLLLTPLSRTRILLGKFLAALWPLVAIVGATGLFTTLALVTWGQRDVSWVLQATGLLLALGMLFGSIGLAASCLLRRASQATATGVLIALVWMAGTRVAYVLGAHFITAGVWGRALRGASLLDPIRVVTVTVDAGRFGYNPIDQLRWAVPVTICVALSAVAFLVAARALKPGEHQSGG